MAIAMRLVPFLRRWAQAKGMRLVELGTEQGNRQLFRLDRLPERETGWLAEHLGGAEEQLVIARFSPEELPLVVVPDRDAELKRRLEDDEADKRISTAALRLARQFTRKLDNRQPSRLYVNLDNPAVQALLAAVGEERDEAAHAAVAAALVQSDHRRTGTRPARDLAEPGPGRTRRFGEAPAGAIRKFATRLMETEALWISGNWVEKLPRRPA
ncbi:putative heat shock protein (hsp90 family) [Pseudomonas aeruginosa]|nr:putative heat shock protein (hsp90 family) [Pseudomonas aeruginosa]